MFVVDSYVSFVRGVEDRAPQIMLAGSIARKTGEVEVLILFRRNVLPTVTFSV